MADTLDVKVVAFLDNFTQRFTADGTGVAAGSLTLPPIPNDQYLYLDRIVLWSNPNGSTFTDFTLFANSVAVDNLREYINVGPLNVAAEPTPVVFAPAETIYPRWRGLTVTTTIVTITITGRYVRRLSRQVADVDRQPPYDEQLADLARESQPDIPS